MAESPAPDLKLPVQAGPMARVCQTPAPQRKCRGLRLTASDDPVGGSRGSTARSRRQASLAYPPATARRRLDLDRTDGSSQMVTITPVAGRRTRQASSTDVTRHHLASPHPAGRHTL